MGKKMKLKFHNLFLLFAWICFFVLKQSIPACVILLCAGINSFVNVLPDVIEEVRSHAKG